ncbi:MAG TPA: hypothetical protein VG145_03150 [Xanthobacteraceae bacterium]|jgi:hypothetical protein|nr:hypothetical protein [Xanthobacteraceae bacterium]
MTHRLVKAARGKHIGKQLDRVAASEAEHLITCPNCGAPIDMRDLGKKPSTLVRRNKAQAFADLRKLVPRGGPACYAPSRSASGNRRDLP